jgi:hypothetical protein
MDTEELSKSLAALKKPGVPSLFALKQHGGMQDDWYAEANKNGIVCFAEILLRSLHERHKDGRVDLPIDFYADNSDVVIEYIQFRDPPNVQVGKSSVLPQIGCLLLALPWQPSSS